MARVDAPAPRHGARPRSFCDGSTRHGAEYAAAAQLTGRFEDELSALTTHQFDLEHVTDAFEAAADESSGATEVTVLP
ncbi:MAG TPA: hypothetical protein VFV42_09575 [Acidimicrobiales bacterium]|nr:hypothetical protein [Acidimicrobiales bacterium]